MLQKAAARARAAGGTSRYPGQKNCCGARSFRLDTVKRNDVVALTEDAARISGISYVMDAYREDAEAILAE